MIVSNPPLPWSDRFLLGHPAMDHTHAEFVACLQALQRADDAGLGPALQAMAAHLAGHFMQEEQWMANTAFPAAQCHADEHAAVLASVNEVQQLLATQGQAAVVRQLSQALADWFPAHADYLDAALSQWLSKRQHGGAPVVLRRDVVSPLPAQQTADTLCDLNLPQG
jgi:hemerythrin